MGTFTLLQNSKGYTKKLFFFNLMKAKWHYSLHTTHSGRCILSPIRIIIIHLTLCMTSPCMCHCSFKKAYCLHCVGEKLVVIITHYTFYIGYFTPCCRFKALFIFTYSDSSETLSGNLKGESEVVVCEYTDRGFSGALVNKHNIMNKCSELEWYNFYESEVYGKARNCMQNF